MSDLPNCCQVHRSRPAMGTLFEIWLAGDDEEHLTAVADAVADEIARLDGRLSRFDARSELSRINRLADSTKTQDDNEVQVDVELFELLVRCQQAWQHTAGYFDITAGSAVGISMADVALLPAARTVRFLQPGVQLDLGAIGKGFALDRAALLLDDFGIASALLHGGTSSVLARGMQPAAVQPSAKKVPAARVWRVGLHWPPGGGDAAREFAQIDLTAAMSTSAVRANPAQTSDLIEPHLGQRLQVQAACTVLAPTAVEAEVWSTALLCMGKERAADYTQTKLSHLHIAWVEPSSEADDSPPRLTWLTAQPENLA